MRLYIDPGTGSMLFAVLIGLIGALNYLLKSWIVKIRFIMSSGKQEKIENDTISIAIFSDDKRYWNVFEPICRELDKMGRNTVYLTASADDPALNNPYPHVKAEFVGEGNRAFTRLNFLKATILLSTTPGLDVYQWKRSKDVQYYVHIPHAASDMVLYRMFGIDYYDAVLLSGDFQAKQIRMLEQMRNIPNKELVKVGIPYMDEMAERNRNTGDVPKHPRTVLVAPTWGKSSLLNVYGNRIINALLETGYHLIIRPHPQSFKVEKEMLDRLRKEFPEGNQIEWNRDNDNFEVLCRSDILVSDFSGVIFDFTLIHDKPVIYTNPKLDLSCYDAWWMDEQLWTMDALPRLGCELKEENISELKNLIDRCIEDPVFEHGRRAVKDECWAYETEGAKRTAQYLIEKHDQLVRVKEE